MRRVSESEGGGRVGSGDRRDEGVEVENSGLAAGEESETNLEEKIVC